MPYNGKNTEITKQQTLSVLQQWFTDHDYGPSYFELGDMLGVSYVAAYHRVLRLARDKKVKFTHGKYRNIQLVQEG